MMQLKEIELTIDGVYKAVDGSIVYHGRKKNNAPRNVVSFVANHFKGCSKAIMLMNRASLDSEILVKKLDKDIVKMELSTDYLEEIIVKAVSIRKDGRKVIEYIDDNFIQKK